jgi:hypothetical protein
MYAIHIAGDGTLGLTAHALMELQADRNALWTGSIAVLTTKMIRVSTNDVQSDPICCFLCPYVTVSRLMTASEINLQFFNSHVSRSRLQLVRRPYFGPRQHW